MSLNDILGHKKQIEQLKNAVKNNRVPHAYLFSGPDGIGKKKIAEEFIKFLNCADQDRVNILSCENCNSCLRIQNENQPDYFYITDQDGSIKIEQVRNLASSLSFKNVITKYKCVIINNCELITAEGANSLLKIIEEPGENVMFFLITSNENRVLPTIRSRAQKINFQQLSPIELKELGEKNNLFSENMDFLIEFSQGSFGKLSSLVSDNDFLEELQEFRSIFREVNEKPLFQVMHQGKIFEKDKKKLLRFLDFYIYTLEKSLFNYSKETINSSINEIIKAQEMLVRNINPRFVAEMVLIKTKLLLKG